MRIILQKNVTQTILWILAIILIWQFSVNLLDNNAYLFPPFSKVMTRLIEDISSAHLLLKAFNSVFLVLEGLIISSLLAFVVALACHKFKIINNLFSFLCTVFIPLPSIALLPLIIIWFGIDREAIIILVCFGIFWMILIQILNSIKQMPKTYIEWAKNIELNTFDYFRLLVIPCIISDLIGTLRIAWGRSWRSAISAEIIFGAIGNKGGLGYYLNYNRQYGRTDGVLAGIILIIIISIIIEKLVFKKMEKHTIERWGLNEK
jgi:ABC-type nitrate/sulfonate/bicarbonate transport system, permease component